EAAFMPFEGTLSFGRVDGGAPAPREHVHDLFVQMALRRGAPAGRELADVHVREVAAAQAVREGAARLHPRPRRELERQQVEAEVLVDRDALALRPLAVGVAQE